MVWQNGVAGIAVLENGIVKTGDAGLATATVVPHPKIMAWFFAGTDDKTCIRLHSGQ